jgi:hypothetical protein
VKVNVCASKQSKPALIKLVFIALMMGLFTICSVAQSPKPAACPTLAFVNPAYEVEAAKPVTLTVKVTGLSPNDSVTYNWTVSAGMISSGQGTDKIEIDTKEVEVNGTITATLEVGGIAPECDRVKSHTIEVIAKKKPQASQSARQSN